MVPNLRHAPGALAILQPRFSLSGGLEVQRGEEREERGMKSTVTHACSCSHAHTHAPRLPPSPPPFPPSLLGGEEELELRACSVEAVERMRAAVAAEAAAEAAAGAGPAASAPNSVQLDWWLWNAGEVRREVSSPHHRTLTMYY